MRHFYVKAAFLVLVIAIFTSSIAAQTKSKAKPLATPLPTLSGAEIISRADDYTDTPPVTTPATKTSTTTNVNAAKIKELNERTKKLEANQGSTYDEKQKRMLLNLDILTRAEQRTESLRKQLFDMIEKENTVKTRLDQIDFDSRPEMIERTLQLMGSMKPEEVRENRRKALDAEKANLQSLLRDIQSTRADLSANLDKAQVLVDKLRTKLEKDMDESFLKDDPPIQN